MNGRRFITKITGYSRFTVLNELFSNPSVIWIERDPRVVIMSYYKQKWYFRQREDQFNQTTKMELLKFYIAKYLSFYEDKKKLSKFNFIQVLYEDIVEDRKIVFTEILNQIGEEINPQFQKQSHEYYFFRIHSCILKTEIARLLLTGISIQFYFPHTHTRKKKHIFIHFPSGISGSPDKNVCYVFFAGQIRI